MISPIADTQEDTEKEYEEIAIQNNENRITGGTEKRWTIRTKRRVHNEDVFCLHMEIF